MRGRSLEDDGWLRASERDQLDAAEEFLTRVRSALHLETGRATDRLLRDQQDDIAAVMGFEDEPRLRAADGLMRAIFEHARAVDALVDDVIIRPSRAAGPMTAVEVADAAAAFELVAAAAEDGRRLAPVELDALEAVASEPVVWDERMRSSFFRILRAGPEGVDGLRALDRTGLLVRAIPGWADVRCRPQRDPYHRYTVDMHLLRAFERASRERWPPRTGTTPSEVVAVGPHPRIATALLLGALLHDVGKNGEGGHVAVGDRVASSILERMGVDGPTRALVMFMVAQHLLLPDTATRRDLADDDLILDVAARIETPERLAALYPPGEGGRARDRSVGMDRVASDADPRVRRQGPAGPRARRDGGGGRRASDRRDRPRARPPPRRSPRARSNDSSCGCRAATSCRSRPRRSRGTTRRSRPIWAVTTCGRRRSPALVPGPTNCWSSPPTDRACCRGSRAHSRSQDSRS